MGITPTCYLYFTSVAVLVLADANREHRPVKTPASNWEIMAIAQGSTHREKILRRLHWEFWT